MRSDATFATPRMPTQMPSRDNLLAQLKGHSLEELKEVLAAVCIREAASDNDDNSAAVAGQSHNNLDNNVSQDRTAYTSLPPALHLGVFAQAYAADELLQAHAQLFANFDNVNLKDVHAYLRTLSDLVLQQRPCFVVCTGDTSSRLLVLHGWRCTVATCARPQDTTAAPSPFSTT